METSPPFNPDHSVTMAFFKDATKLAVTSVFYTIQGEGPYAGHPAVFLRLAGCNFGSKTPFCLFCDTNFQIDRATHYTPLALVDELHSIAGGRRGLVLVITGGEPTLQPLVLEVLALLGRGARHNPFEVFQFESNGTNPEFATALISSAIDQGMLSFGVSPKYNYRTKKCLPPHLVIQDLVERAGFYKFVLSADPENPHHVIPPWALDIAAGGIVPVYVSPIAVYRRAPVGEVASIWDTDLVDHRLTAANYNYAAKYTMQNTGLLLSLQTHLFCAVP